MATASGSTLATKAVAVLGNSPTGFVDLTVTLPAAAPVGITVGTAPAGLAFTVDGLSHSFTHTFTWIAGSPHSISTVQTQQAAAGVQYVWGSWSNGGALSQTVTTPAAPAAYTANFTAQYLLTTSVSPVGAGTIATNATYYNSGTVVSIVASAKSGYQFASFSGALTGTASPASLTMNGPKSVTANFAVIAPVLSAAITLRTGAANARSWTITLTNSGIGLGNNTEIAKLTITPAGTPGCTVAPAIAIPAAGVSASAPLLLGNIGPAGGTSSSASAAVTINFSGCQASSKFTVTVGYTANSGAYSSSTTFSNQFM